MDYIRDEHRVHLIVYHLVWNAKAHKWDNLFITRLMQQDENFVLGDAENLVLDIRKAQENGYPWGYTEDMLFDKIVAKIGAALS
jgi:hypothetical protein